MTFKRWLKKTIKHYLSIDIHVDGDTDKDCLLSFDDAEKRHDLHGYNVVSAEEESGLFFVNLI